MTRKEAITYFEQLLKRFEEMFEQETSYWGRVHIQTTIDAINVALFVLRPVSREQVAKVWRGEWERITDPYGKLEGFLCKCGTQTYSASHFCPHCGAPMTDEAVQMVMERIKVLYEDNG